MLRLASGRLLDRAEHGMAGDYEVREATRVDVLSYAFVDVICSKMVLPRDCVRLVWCRPAVVDGCAPVCEVRVEFQGLTDAMRLCIEDGMGALDYCDCCYCAWVYEGPGYWCSRCESCSCRDCVVHDAGGEPVCMFCLERGDWDYLVATYDDRIIFRCRLLSWQRNDITGA